VIDTDHFSLIYQKALHLLELRYLPHHVLMHIELPCKTTRVPWNRHRRIHGCTFVNYPREVRYMNVADGIIDMVGGARWQALSEVSYLTRRTDTRFTARYSEGGREVCPHCEHELVPFRLVLEEVLCLW